MENTLIQRFYANHVITSIIDEFQFSLPLDNELLIADIKNGVPISENEIIEVAINSRTLFVVSTLACRELERVEDCFKLWTEMAELIAGLLTSWSEITAGQYPQVDWLLTELRHLQALCDDRKELYCVTAADRRRHVETRGDACFEYSFSQRNNLEARGENQGSPAHVYSLRHF
jgi:hypothetical protein